MGPIEARVVYAALSRALTAKKKSLAPKPYTTIAKGKVVVVEVLL